ncbi:SRPBCC family protein [Gillisia sp. M10.2A]|uniref:SRPBCC family protein n=1 Tax=Gillisia lutea TaxID=2909668 RepID=A0ABS9ELW1_9FLAO|nr:SRPBCC family protein [Gillisia lutea]MCF4102483.1 SRPBCC family protein [Gillisia lutea]
MNYSKEIIIHAPREEVVAKLKNPKNFKHWQKGFISYKHITGIQGKPDARSRLKYKMGNRKIEMIETIIKENSPNELHLSYDAQGVFNIQKNYFEVESENATLWISYNDFEFSGFMKILGTLMPGIFKKQSLKYMQDFKAFVENGTSILNK